MPSPLHDVRRYACPGEAGDISRSVHLARLASSFAKCADCPHRHETGALRHESRNPAAKEASPPTETRGLLQTPAGFRGSYLNQLGRRQAISWASALAALLWDDGPPIVMREDEPDRLPELPPLRSAPVVVLGYDERPAAPDLLVGAAMGLTRMSCQVIEIGLTTEPCLRFAVQQLQADAGLFVTGSGCDPAGIGFDLIRQWGLPPEPEFLHRWQDAQQSTCTRPSRSAGQLRAFSPVAQYESRLWTEFHALRPLQVVCGATSPQLLTRLERIFSRLPGRITTTALPVRNRDLSNPSDPDVQRVGTLVREQSAQLGVVIDDDGTACGFLDEQGRLVNTRRLQALLIEHLLQEQSAGTVILSTDIWDDLAPIVTALHGRPVLVAEPDRAARLMASAGLVALGTDQRMWLRGETPVCDAIVTLAVVMQLLSRSDAEFSRVLPGV